MIWVMLFLLLILLVCNPMRCLYEESKSFQLADGHPARTSLRSLSLELVSIQCGETMKVIVVLQTSNRTVADVYNSRGDRVGELDDPRFLTGEQVQSLARTFMQNNPALFLQETVAQRNFDIMIKNGKNARRTQEMIPEEAQPGIPELEE